jgi:carboxyl-terminal processing protease
LLSDKLRDSKGLIFDMRDGYGGAFFDDLDYFFRPPKAYPTMTVYDRSGKRHSRYLFYDKPVVALINGGSRSGKELLSFALKQSGRAKLVGETTAGMVLGGRLFDINDRCALYLAVQGVEIDGQVLEGKGVRPDVEVKLPCVEKGLKDSQLEEARNILIRETSLPLGQVHQ